MAWQRIDIGKLIREVQNRPALWNTGNRAYNDRAVRKECWEEIVYLFAKPDSTAEERRDLCKYRILVILRTI
nr:unnamed protein product [Callosobruchus analis]